MVISKACFHWDCISQGVRSCLDVLHIWSSPSLKTTQYSKNVFTCAKYPNLYLDIATTICRWSNLRLGQTPILGRPLAWKRRHRKSWENWAANSNFPPKVTDFCAIRKTERVLRYGSSHWILMKDRKQTKKFFRQVHYQEKKIVSIGSWRRQSDTVCASKPPELTRSGLRTQNQLRINTERTETDRVTVPVSTQDCTEMTGFHHKRSTVGAYSAAVVNIYHIAVNALK